MRQSSSVTISEAIEPELLFGIIEIDLNVVPDHHDALHRGEGAFGGDGSTEEMPIVQQHRAAMRYIDVEPAGDAREQLLIRGIINRREGSVGVRVAVNLDDAPDLPVRPFEKGRQDGPWTTAPGRDVESGSRSTSPARSSARAVDECADRHAESRARLRRLRSRRRGTDGGAAAYAAQQSS